MLLRLLLVFNAVRRAAGTFQFEAWVHGPVSESYIITTSHTAGVIFLSITVS